MKNYSFETWAKDVEDETRLIEAQRSMQEQIEFIRSLSPEQAAEAAKLFEALLLKERTKGPVEQIDSVEQAEIERQRQTDRLRKQKRKGK